MLAFRCVNHVTTLFLLQVSVSTDDNQFDYAAMPPFTLADIRSAIPAKCFEKDTFRSLSYLARDCLAVAGLAAGALAINHPLIWPIYWLGQGTMFWALFVVGHDCGHGSFSNIRWLNDFVGKNFSIMYVGRCVDSSRCEKLKSKADYLHRRDGSSIFAVSGSVPRPPDFHLAID